MSSLDETYPTLAAWVKQEGRIEIGYGYDANDRSFLRVIQYTDVIWCSDRTYTSLDEALAEMEEAIAQWCREQGISLGDG